MPKVSVILTSFNHEKFICEAIDSVLNQTFTDFELIIWDDASTDNSWDLINQYSDPRIKAFRNEVQRRGGWGVNKAILEVATGEYIAIHHSDDVWELNKLEKQVAFLNANTDIGAVFTNALAINENSLPLTDKHHFYTDVFNKTNRPRHEWLHLFFREGNALCHPSVLIRKQCYKDCGSYRYGLAQLGDFDMWMRLCLKYEIHVLPEPLVRFRVRDNEINTSGNREETRIRWKYEFYELLANYQTIKNFDDLVKIFPSAEKYQINQEADMDFVLAMSILEENTELIFSKLFGLNLLFRTISSDLKRAENIKSLYNFDYKDFIALTAKYDVFSTEEVFRLQQEITVCGNQIEAQRQEIQAYEEQDHVFSDQIQTQIAVIAELNTTLNERNITINELNTILHERNITIIELNTTLHERNITIIELNTILHERNITIIELNTILHERNITIIELNTILHERNITIIELNTILDERDETIHEICTSRSWRFTRPLRLLYRLIRDPRLLWSQLHE